MTWLPARARRLFRPIAQWRAVQRGYNHKFDWRTSNDASAPPARPNSLKTFFDLRKEGPGIWKWNHYFDIYDRHFHRFRGQSVRVLEIGVYSGGSLDMWRDYFGPKAELYGVDIEPACRVYEASGVKMLIGDQADRNFWRDVRKKIPAIDIVIDDGGHELEQQIVSVEELLPFLRPGGVYLCEDMHGAFNRFASYIHGLSHRLNDYSQSKSSADDPKRRLVSICTPFQSAIGSIHLYPFVTVLERKQESLTEFQAPKHGSQWQPFLR
jgi:23S rRNA U2552 (ribose-2'-O)-methylase RlmE/FtsJ